MFFATVNLVTRVSNVHVVANSSQEVTTWHDWANLCSCAARWWRDDSESDRAAAVQESGCYLIKYLNFRRRRSWSKRKDGGQWTRLDLARWKRSSMCETSLRLRTRKSSHAKSIQKVYPRKRKLMFRFGVDVYFESFNEIRFYAFKTLSDLPTTIFSKFC